MNQDGQRSGVVLVTVLLVSAAIWVILAGLLLTVRLRHEVAVAALHNVRAHALALHVAQEADGHDWWSQDQDDYGEHLRGSVGPCTWDVQLLRQTPSITHYEVLASYGRAQVRVDGSAIR